MTIGFKKDFLVKKKRNRRDKTRFIYTQILNTLTCQICGEDHNSVLDFHHIDPTTKLSSVSDLKSKDYSWEIMVEEMSKCACLCSNCHRKYHSGVDMKLQKELKSRLTKAAKLAITNFNIPK